MIRTLLQALFLPEAVGSYYLFGHRIAACEITKTSVKVAVTKASGNQRTIEAVIEFPMEDNPARPYPERAAEALSGALSSVGSYDVVYAILPSNMVICKELTLPFASLEKIKLVLPFEVEPLLPFALHDAVVDCIVTESRPNSSTVLAVAIKNELLTEQLMPYQLAGITPERATVDMVELYALYKKIYPAGSHDNVLLLYSGLTTTRLGIIIKRQLKTVRFLAYGLGKLARLLNYDPDQLMHSTLSGDDLQHIAPFMTDIQFTLQALAAPGQAGQAEEKPQKIILTGTAVEVRGLAALIESATGLPCETLSGQAILQHNLAKLKSNHGIPNKSIISISSSLTLPETHDFNLFAEPQAAAQEKLMSRQLIAAGAIMFLILGSVITAGFIKTRKLRQEIQASEKEAVGKLKRELPAITGRVKGNALELIKNAARNEVAREKNIWFALSNQSRSSFLMYLQELSRRIDTEGLGLLLSRLTLTDEFLTLEGRVKNYDALKALEEDLRRSKMFAHVPRLQELTFTIKLPLDKNYGETQ